MTILEAANLFERTLPDDAVWVLEALNELDGLRTASGSTKDERRKRATVLYRRLLQGLEGLREPTPPEHVQSGPLFREWFTEAVLLWVRFSKTGSAPTIDTVGADTLKEFPVDLPPDAPTVARVKEAARRAFDWSPEQFAVMERRVEHLTSNLGLKRDICRALSAHLGEGDRLDPAGRLVLMSQFYGELPFHPGDVDVLLVATAIFFFLPRKGNGLDVEHFAERSDDERRKVREFFEKLDRSNNAETRRFPSFGLYEPDRLDGALVERLAETVGAPPSVVKSTLSTMFSFIPRALHAQYLVHDLWGHTWQEALSEFEWEYALVPYLDRPLSPDDGPEFGGNGAPKLVDAFRVDAGEVLLDEARLLAFGERDLRGRVQVATSVPLSEVLADFMESKFSRARPKLELPTTSLLASTSLKIDLTIGDTRAQIRRYTQPYRALAVDPEDQARFAGELRARGLPEGGLLDAVRRAGRILWLTFAPAFDDTLRPEPAEGGSGGGGIRSSVMRRLLLQFALVMADFEHVLALTRPDSASDEPWRHPASCPDFFAVAFTHFYEQDRQKNFFYIDQIARNEFVPACARLERALEELTGAPGPG
jgi:hypothetical protein